MPAELRRYSVIECECRKVTEEKLGRRESHRVREGSIKIVHQDYVKPVDWTARKRWVLPLLGRSIDQLKERFSRDRTSLGLIRPRELMEFHHVGPLRTDLHGRQDYQVTIEGKKVPIVTKIDHQFKYKFKCQDCGTEDFHDMTCEDWELLESYRSWGKRYPEEGTLWEKLNQRYFTDMVEKKDLHFFMGMHSRQPAWMIIGLFYPPIEGKNGGPNQLTFDAF